MNQKHETSIFHTIKNTNSEIKAKNTLKQRLNEKTVTAYISAFISVLLSVLGIVLLELKMTKLQMFITPFVLIASFHFASYALGIGRDFFHKVFSIEFEIEFERNHYTPLVDALMNFSDQKIKKELSIMKGVAKELKRRAKLLLMTGVPLITVLSYLLQVERPKSIFDFLNAEINANTMTVWSVAAGIYLAYWVTGSLKLNNINYYIDVLQHRLDWESVKN